MTGSKDDMMLDSGVVLGVSMVVAVGREIQSRAPRSQYWQRENRRVCDHVMCTNVVSAAHSDCLLNICSSRAASNTAYSVTIIMSIPTLHDR
jgi:hypothetical protein